MTRGIGPPSVAVQKSASFLSAESKCGILNQSHTRSISCQCPSIPKFATKLRHNDANFGIGTLAVAEQAPEFGAHRRRDVAALERIGDVGRKKAHLRAAVEAPAVEFEPIERLGLGELDHRISELDLAACTAP